MKMDGLEQISPYIHKMRTRNPNLVTELANNRKKRLNWAGNRLVILAFDHPARRVVRAGGDPWAMANRNDVLMRIVSVLMQPGIDGLLATPDIIEEVSLANHWITEQGGQSFLDEKILVGSMNRAGLADTVFELDDFVTAYTPESIQQMNLDAGKLLLRLDPTTRDSAQTIRYCVEALDELSKRNLPCFLEPLAVPQSTDDLVRLVGVASALGSTSRNRWLKLPMVEDFERVSQATTCPILLLGGGNPGSTEDLIRNVERCLDAGENVSGLMIGRGVLYPEDSSNPAQVAAALATVVHGRR